MTFIFLLLFIGLFGITLVMSMLKGIISFLFGKSDTSAQKRYKSAYSDKNTNSDFNKNKKIFGKNEGEYVSYEEIKD